jgi:hypothetical protein
MSSTLYDLLAISIQMEHAPKVMSVYTQIMVAKAINDDLISRTLLNFKPPVNILSSNITSSKDDVYQPQYHCNGDSMHHVGKGIMTII